MIATLVAFLVALLLFFGVGVWAARRDLEARLDRESLEDFQARQRDLE